MVGTASIGLRPPPMAAGATHTTTYLLPTARRGCYTIGPLHIGRSDPLSFMSVSHSVSAEATLWVLPTIHKASPIPTGRSQELEGPTSNSAPRGGIAFHCLREYAPGDDPRLIHWRSTARTGTLMVRHTVITNEPRLLIVLDTSSDPYDEESFEDAVRVAASLVSPERTSAIRPSSDHRWHQREHRPDRAWPDDVMDKLAAVLRSSDDPGLKGLISMAPQRDRGVSLGVVTGQPASSRPGLSGLSVHASTWRRPSRSASVSSAHRLTLPASCPSMPVPAPNGPRCGR